MVLYHANGKPVRRHEDYLETEAAQQATKNKYEEQIEPCKRHNPHAKDNKDRVYLIVEKQEWPTLYSEHDTLWESMPRFNTTRSTRIPEEGLDRATLMACSSHADDFFRYDSDATELILPIMYPRRHVLGLVKNYKDIHIPKDAPYPFPESWRKFKYTKRFDCQMAHIRAAEIEEYIVPWLLDMERDFAKAKGKNAMTKASENGFEDDSDEKVEYDTSRLKKVSIPGDLLGKIHLYNVMLQLGLPRFVQQPLIDSLVAQMYQTNLNACELETLEMTVGRFYSQGVAVLDPVLCHFVGTYPLRRLNDRQNPEPLDEAPIEPVPNKDADAENTSHKRKTKNATKTSALQPYDFTKSTRKYLDFLKHPAYRADFPKDTVILPPKLSVLGHSIRHWSGMRRNGHTAPSYHGLPLNIGRVLKHYRRHPTHRIHPKSQPESQVEPDVHDTEERQSDPYYDDTLNNHYVEYSSHRLSRLDCFKRLPGVEEVIELE